MKVHEFVGKALFKENGIKVPKSILVKESDMINFDMEFPVVVKSQVLVGGRMKNGGVLFAGNEEELENSLNSLLNKKIKGEKPYGVLIEEMINIKKEYYLSIMIDRNNRDLMFVFSEEGGIEIESSKKIIKGTLEEITPKIPYNIVKFFRKLESIFIENDLTLLEINPLALDKDYNLVALDAVLNIDDNALYRNKWINSFIPEKSDFHYVKLDGDVGIIGCGAGIVMATMDGIKQKGFEPANFLDIGGGANKETTLSALNLLKSEGIKNIVLNIFGGITKCDEIANAIVKFQNENSDITLHIRLTGTNETIAKQILKDNNIEYYNDMQSLIESVEGVRL